MQHNYREVGYEGGTRPVCAGCPKPFANQVYYKNPAQSAGQWGTRVLKPATPAPIPFAGRYPSRVATAPAMGAFGARGGAPGPMNWIGAFALVAGVSYAAWWAGKNYVVPALRKA